MPNDFLSVIQPGGAPDAEKPRSHRALPVLPVRETVLFPHAVLPLTVGRESSIQLIQSLGDETHDSGGGAARCPAGHARGERPARCRHAGDDPQSREDAEPVAFRVYRGNERVRLGAFGQTTPFLTAEFERIPDVEGAKTPELEALQRNVVSQFQQIVAASPTLSDDLQTIALNIEEPGRLADFIGSSLPFLTTNDKQELLETTDVVARLERLNQHLVKEIEVQQLRSTNSERSAGRGAAVAARVLPARADEGDQQGAGRAGRDRQGCADLRDKIEAAGMPEETKKEALKELDRLQPDEPGAGRLWHDAQLRGVAGGAAVGEVERRGRRHQARRQSAWTKTTTGCRR